MSTYNKTSTYNRTYERKVTEEPRLIGMSTVGGGGGPPINISSSTFATTPMFMGHPATTSLHNYTFGSTSGSFRSTDDSFEATLDVSPFKPEELKVSVIGAYIVVEARHPEKSDDLGLIERHFVRKFHLPKYVNPDLVTSNLTHDGQLTISAMPPKLTDNSPSRAIPIKIVPGSQQATNGTAGH